ncbi:hypothetical protein EDB82DRAFT_99543 [Fusarium venenatum]|uniref:uncharacterized protein n=1 Tax=Fusarium venenatum TaxID=56646 RepID=UPI001DBC1DD7|nr:hypothetical protein EDB82DRAFT_99543 [Fusarium venenatum]
MLYDCFIQTSIPPTAGLQLPNFLIRALVMSEAEKTRPAIIHQLKPAPRRPAQTVHSPRLKSEVHFTHPGSIPDIAFSRSEVNATILKTQLSRCISQVRAATLDPSFIVCEVHLCKSNLVHMYIYGSDPSRPGLVGPADRRYSHAKQTTFVKWHEFFISFC